MRRLGTISIVCLALVALLGVGVLAKGSGAAFSVKASKANQGGRMTIEAKASKSVKGAFVATAVVHFASGDVAVALVRKGSKAEASVKVPVLRTEQPGAVRVDVTILYLGTPRIFSVKGQVRAKDAGVDHGHDG